MIQLKQRLDALNQLRIERATANMGAAFQQVYTLLPVFLHYHHPALPGYHHAHVPNGICAFTPNEAQARYLADFSQEDAIHLTAHVTNTLPITGVYSMGSTSSVGQSQCSDLDIWLCHQSWLSSSERSALQEKCLLLERWASAQGVDVNFFLIDENRFRQNQRGALNCEDCGSTQHILLLDEFYRSAVCMAGKPLLWNMVPTSQELNYESYITALFANGTLNRDEWIDFGGLGALSAEEYFGASLWQLYKSIDSPYKAVLKTLLLETYSWEYPQSQLLALELKKRLHDDEPDALSLDAYYMMLEKVTTYLQAMGDETRLDLARRCFYLKVCEPLSEHHNKRSVQSNWRREALHQLTRDWGWDSARIHILDDRPNWKIERVLEANNELLDALMQSYRNLIRFARRNNLSVSASPQDIGVLTRKLYAAFEALPGKVTLVNPQISPDLSENDLTFIHVPVDRANRAGWYLYNRAPNVEEIVGRQPLEYSRYLSKLVAWSYFNGLLTAETQLHVKNSPKCDTDKLRAFAADIAKHFPLRVPAPTPKALYSPCEIRQLALIVNLESDPTETLLHETQPFDLGNLDVFSFGSQEQCLIGSVDLLYRNSWNEIRTLHFSGSEAVIEALKTILGKMHQDAMPPESVDVFCYSEHLRGLIQTRVQQLVSECINLRLSSTRQDSNRFKALKLAGQTWGLFFERLSVSVQKLENAVEFYGAISKNKLNSLAAEFNAGEALLPEIIDGSASEGIIQFFFEDTHHGFNIYVLDELNHVEVYLDCQGCIEELVCDISRFYASSHARFTYGAGSINFNLPQFYQIVRENGEDEIIPYNSHSISPLSKPLPNIAKPGPQLSHSF